jgi:riboflavin synthase
VFTGLIEEVGLIESVTETGGGKTLAIQAKQILSDVQIGDSISVDGTCTTAIKLESNLFWVEVTPETLSKTLFQTYEPGTPVNLERPLLPHSRLGGHFVSGHVDTLATVTDRYSQGNSWIYVFELDNKNLGPLLIEKGSVAINGISLTVNTVNQHCFTVAIIPHTLEKTNIGEMVLGSKVNIEVDILGKYVQSLLAHQLKGEVHTLGMTLETVNIPAQSKIHGGNWFNFE